MLSVPLLTRAVLIVPALGWCRDFGAGDLYEVLDSPRCPIACSPRCPIAPHAQHKGLRRSICMSLCIPLQEFPPGQLKLEISAPPDWENTNS